MSEREGTEETERELWLRLGIPLGELRVTITVMVIVAVGGGSCLMNQTQNDMAYAIIHLPFHCGALSLCLHLLASDPGV